MEVFIDRAGPWAITLAEHNWPVLIYVPLIIWVASRAFLRPDRREIMLLYGLVILALAFEYQKHGIPIVAETVDYLFDAEETPFMRSVAEFVLLDAPPVAGRAVGLSFVVISVAWPALRGLRRSGSPPGSSSSKELEGEAQASSVPLTPS